MSQRRLTIVAFIVMLMTSSFECAAQNTNTLNALNANNMNGTLHDYKTGLTFQFYNQDGMNETKYTKEHDRHCVIWFQVYNSCHQAYSGLPCQRLLIRSTSGQVLTIDESSIFPVCTGKPTITRNHPISVIAKFIIPNNNKLDDKYGIEIKGDTNAGWIPLTQNWSYWKAHGSWSDLRCL